MNRQTEIENIIRTLWDIDDVTVNVESKNAIKKALQSLQDVRMALKKENDNFKNVRGISSSRKSIKSDSDWHARNDYQNKEIYREAFASLVKDSDAQDFDNSPYGTVHYPGFYRVLVDGTYETEFSAETDEEAIQKFKDYFAESRGITNSHKLIKSSLEDRLVPYLEEFEEGYANAITRDSEDANEFNHVYEDTFFEQFKSDYNLTDTDIQKLDRAVREIWDASSTEEGEVRDMGEMYGAPRGATPEEALKHFE